MSQPTIYWFGGTGMTADRYGFRGNRMEDSQGYIRFTDYAALAAENERLRKAGDDLAFYAQEDGTGWELHDAAKMWLAAKEGRDAK